MTDRELSPLGRLVVLLISVVVAMLLMILGIAALGPALDRPVSVGNLIAFALGIGIGAFFIIVARLTIDATGRT